MDSDDTVNSTYLKELLTHCTEGGAAMCNLQQFNKSFFEARDVFIRNLLIDNIGGQLWRFMFHKSLWENIRMPESRYAEDAMVIHKVLNKSNIIEFIDEELYLYNSTNENSSSNNKKNLLKNSLDRSIMFFERLKWANEQGYFECEETILCKATGFAIGAIGCYKAYDYKIEDIDLICNNLNKYFSKIMKNKQISFSRKIALIIIKISPDLYYGVRGLWKRK